MSLFATFLFLYCPPQIRIPNLLFFASVLGINLWATIAYLTAPVALGKSLINLLQLGLAAVNMASLDTNEQQKKCAQ